MLKPLLVTASLLFAGLLMSSAAQGASRTEVEFFAPSPGSGDLSCAIYDGPTGAAEAFCQVYGPLAQAKATVRANGTLVVCRSRDQKTNRCGLGNAGENAKTYGYGRSVTVGRFRCEVLRKGVRCVVRSTGKGFLMSPQSTRPVGGAVIGSGGSAKKASATQHVETFLSADRSVWCVLGPSVEDQFCATGGLRPKVELQSSAGFRSDGTVKTCAVKVSNLTEGCVQNWDSSAPVLPVGAQDELNGIRCTSTNDGIFCFRLRAPGKGNGFRIDKEKVLPIEG